MAMGDGQLVGEWQAIGIAAIGGEWPKAEQLPWDFDDTVFRCAWEYTVTEFHLEVGFHLAVLGLATIALDDDYALFTTPGGEIQLACRAGEAGASLRGHRLTLMTRQIDRFAAALATRLPPDRIERSAGSPVQTVISLTTPAGLTIDVWEDPGIRDESN